MRALVKSLRVDELAALEKTLEGGGHGEIPRANVCSSPDPPMRDVKAMLVSRMRNADPEAFAIVVDVVAEERARRG